MGRVTKFRDLIGAIKDKASQSKAALLSSPNTFSFHLSILKSTTHDPTNPPHEKHLTTLLSFGKSSRATASSVIESLMDRLHQTRDASVALKCLITIHHIIRRGTFILQDQLSVYPTYGGRNYLKLSNFRDNTTPATWILSSWVRWYAKYLEQLLSTSRIIGFFLSSSNSYEEEKEEKISALINKDLLREFDSLVSLIEEICRVPDFLEGNKLVCEVMGLVGDDYLSVINEAYPRIGEFKERLSLLSFGESVESVFGLKRLEDCRERIMEAFSERTIKKGSTVEMFWGLVSEMKDKIGMVKGYREEKRLLVIGRRESVSESARFGDRVMRNSGDSVSFSSERFCLDSFQFPVMES